jgi:transcriptional regulator with XRE-family HTH domain
MSLKETKKQLMSDPLAAARIKAEVAEAHRAVALADLRQGQVTQSELAGVLGVSQRRVSAIEHSTDIQISTLRAYLEKLGYTLELVARSEEGERIPLRVG